MEYDPSSEGSIEAYRATCKDSESIYAQCAKCCGLSEAEYWILLMLHEGVDTQSGISEQLFISKQTVNSACKQLIKKGLVHLETLEHNLRTKKIVFTEAGTAFVEEHISSVDRIEETVWNMMPAEERMMLIHLTRKYNRLMKAELQQYRKTK
jgi:DNA-binding MarR family transcriptional regulator